MCVCLTVYVCGTFFLLLGAAWRKKKLDNSLFSPRYFPFFWPLVDFFMTFFCFFFLPCIFPRDLLGKINFLSSYSSSMMKKKKRLCKELGFFVFYSFQLFRYIFFGVFQAHVISLRETFLRPRLSRAFLWTRTRAREKRIDSARVEGGYSLFSVGKKSSKNDDFSSFTKLDELTHTLFFVKYRYLVRTRALVILLLSSSCRSRSRQAAGSFLTHSLSGFYDFFVWFFSLFLYFFGVFRDPSTFVW